MIEIAVRTTTRRQMVNVDAQVREALAATGVDDGLCHLWVPHTTAAVVVNENADPAVVRDLLAAYSALVPDIPFAHAEGNSDAHLLSTLVGGSLTLPVEGGKLCLGTWQGIFFVEFDGPRPRKMWLKTLPAKT